MRDDRVVIEAGVPLPDDLMGLRDHGSRGKYLDALRRMGVGESFLCPSTDINRCRVGMNMISDKVFTSRKQHDGSIRVWRVA